MTAPCRLVPTSTAGHLQRVVGRLLRTVEGFKRNFAGTGKKFPTWVEIVGKPARDARWPDRIEVARDLSIMGGGHGQGTDHSQADHSGLSELPLGGRGVRQS